MTSAALAQQLQQPDVRNVLSQYRAALDEMYNFYARLKHPNGGTYVLELDELLHLLGDFKLTPSDVTREDARSAFKQSENDDDNTLRDAINRVEFESCMLRLANAHATHQPTLASAAAWSKRQAPFLAAASCGHAPLRKPTRLLGAAREKFPRRLHADADDALWRRSGACLIRCVLPPVPQVVLVAFLVQNGESNWLQGLMLVVAYCIVSLGFFVHCDQNGEDGGCPSPFRKSEA